MAVEGDEGEEERGEEEGHWRYKRNLKTRQPLEIFLNKDNTEIKSANHAAALEGLLQMAMTHRDDVLCSLGDRHRTNWLRDKLVALFHCKRDPLDARLALFPAKETNKTPAAVACRVWEDQANIAASEVGRQAGLVHQITSPSNLYIAT